MKKKIVVDNKEYFYTARRKRNDIGHEIKIWRNDKLYVKGEVIDAYRINEEIITWFIKNGEKINANIRL